MNKLLTPKDVAEKSQVSVPEEIKKPRQKNFAYAAPTSEYATPEEISKMLRVSLSHVRKMTSRKLIPHTKVGSRVFYPVSKVTRWLEANTVEPRRPTARRPV